MGRWPAPQPPTADPASLTPESMRAWEERAPWLRRPALPPGFPTPCHGLPPGRKRKNVSPGQPLPCRVGQPMGWENFFPAPSLPRWPEGCWKIPNTGNTNGQMAGSRQGRYTHTLAGTEALHPKRGGSGLRPPTPIPAGASLRACLLGNRAESQEAPSFPTRLHTYTKPSSFCRLNAPQNHPLLSLLNPR